VGVYVCCVCVCVCGVGVCCVCVCVVCVVCECVLCVCVCVCWGVSVLRKRKACNVFFQQRAVDEMKSNFIHLPRWDF